MKINTEVLKTELFDFEWNFDKEALEEKRDYYVAKKFFDAGYIDDALCELRSLLKKFPDFVPALLNTAQIFLTYGSNIYKLPYCNKALSIQPQNARAYLIKGEIKAYLKNKMNVASKCFKEAIKIDPTDYYTYYRIGVLYGFGLRDFKKGIEYLKKAIACEGYPVGILVDIGLLYYRIDDFESAVEFHDRFLSEATFDIRERTMGEIKNICLELFLLEEGFTGGSLKDTLLDFKETNGENKCFEQLEPDCALISEYMDYRIEDLKYNSPIEYCYYDYAERIKSFLGIVSVYS